MIPARYRDWVFIGVMTLLMSLAVSGPFTFWGDYQGTFLRAWAVEFARTYIVVVPAALVAAPVARKLTAKIVAPPAETNLSPANHKSADDAARGRSRQQ